ncbi:hypothetical protein BGHDH14_bgh00295 [Blumeria hordei DH14]|uniref:Riboflavin kinase n=1 Tax=Blumeria graminis f. sp. hordei (strain DH14) TaxID=546991 RepID=N1J9F5_BLUG1|nr:hypothetical protein BGHDH14_bgh00295 [Blumeria hordei DH14]
MAETSNSNIEDSIKSEALSTQQRPQIIGDNSGPQAPYPLRIDGVVVTGFGRGSKELGIPTANLPTDSKTTTTWIATAKSGVYFGWCSIRFPLGHPALDFPSRLPSSRILEPDFQPPKPGFFLSELSQQEGWRLYPMVMSIGYNPFYKNEVRSAEVHVLNGFDQDFYDSPMRVSLLGFIREERDYSSLEELVKDIKIDCEVAARSLARREWKLAGDKWKKECDWLAGKQMT